jgi:hypothetical protein
VADLYDPREQWASFLLNAVKAKELFIRDVSYIVRSDEVGWVLCCGWWVGGWMGVWALWRGCRGVGWDPWMPGRQAGSGSSIG